MITATQIRCYCGAKMVEKPSKFKNSRFLSCSRYPACGGAASLHRDGTIMSSPADQKTRDLRHEAHLAFDPIWRTGLMSRDSAYRQLAKLLGLPFKGAHIGFLDAKQCATVIEFFKGIAPERVKHHSRQASRSFRRHRRLEARQ
jgi:ssDNA-binding Zn-finger/Zn-ribbon topoisomerase 1